MEHTQLVNTSITSEITLRTEAWRTVGGRLERLWGGGGVGEGGGGFAV